MIVLNVRIDVYMHVRGTHFATLCCVRRKISNKLIQSLVWETWRKRSVEDQREEGKIILKRIFKKNRCKWRGQLIRLGRGMCSIVANTVRSTEFFIRSMNTKCLKCDSRIYFRRRNIRTHVWTQNITFMSNYTCHTLFFNCCTVHFDIYKVHSPTNALCIKLDKVHIREPSLEPS